MAHAEMTLKPFTTTESGKSEARYSALDSAYWFPLLLLLTSTRILPVKQQDKEQTSDLRTHWKRNVMQMLFNAADYSVNLLKF